MRYHIVGSDSYISRRFLENYEKKINARLLSRSSNKSNDFVDLNNPNDFDFTTIEKDDIIVFFAAVSSPDICEKEREYAHKINVEGTKIFIENCIKKESRVLFFSSDVVYGKASGISEENSPVAPFGAYAFMKREIEEYFKDSSLVKIFRLSYVWSKNDKFTKYLESCATTKKVAEVFDSLFRNVVYINDVTECIYNLSKTWELWNNQVFHICGKQLLSRYDIAKMFQEEIYKDLSCIKVEPDENFYICRAKSISMKSLYIERLLNRPVALLKDAMNIEFKL